VIKPTQVQTPHGGGGGGGEGEEAVWVVKSKAETVFKGVRGFLFESSRRLYFPHNQIIVVGKDAAREGVGPLLDFFTRDAEPRLSEWFLVAEGEAAEVLQAKAGLEKIPALAISRLLNNYTGTSEIGRSNLLGFLTRLLSKTTAPYAPLIKVEGEGAELKYRISGTAVFRKDKYIGELNKRETRGLLWLLGEVQDGIVTMDYGGGKVDVELIKSACRIRPEMKDGSIRMQVEIRAEGNLGANLAPVDFSVTERTRDLNSKLATAIKGEVEASLEKARTLQADLFAFGEAVQRKYPKEWRELEKKWTEIFPLLEVEIDVRTNLRLLGLTTRPTIIKEE
ncbi:MAG TPA: Ger(x)C family spore germination protein, partial [Bacillota bacterium]